MEKDSTQLSITSIEDLMEYSRGQIVRLPDFAFEQPFVARLKRPSLLGMIKQNKIPNSLLVKANELFIQDTTAFDSDEKNLLSEMFDIIELIAEETFVEPKYSVLKRNGIELTDEQLMFVFNYSQQGVKALESFRTE